MAFQAPLALPTFATAARESWPSVRAVFQTPWRTASNKAPYSQHAVRRRRPFARRSEASIRPPPPYTQSRTFSIQPDLNNSRQTSLSSLRRQLAHPAPHSAPSAMGFMGSLSRPPCMRIGPFTLRPMPTCSTMAGVWHARRAVSSQSYNNLAHLEEMANKHANSPSSQASFYTSLLRANRPDIVVQRYESNRYATNGAIDILYQRALEKQGQLQNDNGAQLQNNTELSTEQLQAVGQAVGARAKGGNIASTKAGSGGKGSPLYVVVEESTGASIFRWMKLLIWFAFAVWIIYVIMTVAVEAGGMLRKVGQSSTAPAKPEMQKTRFSDVHGADEAKEELQELVEFLKNPEKFSALGGKLPKGVLLTGPPGTGKTLLARASAGVAGVPFFYMSGSEFDEVYVGVGAKRVRELFQAARSKAPAIVFIDELDAIGGKRSERDHAYAKQTLNQLLTDLDGFDQSTGVIFLAATNFPESLDKALLRPGRFDRNVAVPLPDVRGRVSILKHHMRNMKTDADVDPTVLGRGTPGFSGAELENLVNQAAVHASKNRNPNVSMLDFEWAKDKILMGAERRSAVITEKDKIATAYHEGGHALVALYSKYADPLYKATIMPRGHALGITFQLPEMDKVSMSKREYLARIDVCMGGKVAEELLYGEDAVTSGASSDIQKATSLAYNMVTSFGMSERLGNLDLASDYARLPPETKQMIWEEVRRIVEDSKRRAETLLQSKRKELDLLASALVEYETLNKEEMETVVAGRQLEGKLKADKTTPVKMPEVSKGQTLKPGPLPGSSEGPRKPPSGSGGLGVPLPPTPSPDGPPTAFPNPTPP